MFRHALPTTRVNRTTNRGTTPSRATPITFRLSGKATPPQPTLRRTLTSVPSIPSAVSWATRCARSLERQCCRPMGGLRPRRFDSPAACPAVPHAPIPCATCPLTHSGDSASPLPMRAFADPLKSASRDVAWLVPEDPSELSRNGTNPKTLIDLIPLTRHLGFALQNAPASLSAAVRRKRHSRQRPGGR